jgi:hypothetical protein
MTRYYGPSFSRTGPQFPSDFSTMAYKECPYITTRRRSYFNGGPFFFFFFHLELFFNIQIQIEQRYFSPQVHINQLQVKASVAGPSQTLTYSIGRHMSHVRFSFSFYLVLVLVCQSVCFNQEWSSITHNRNNLVYNNNNDIIFIFLQHNTYTLHTFITACLISNGEWMSIYYYLFITIYYYCYCSFAVGCSCSC